MTQFLLYRAIVIVTATLLLNGCVAIPQTPQVATAISAKLPVMTALPETKESQEKGGIVIAVATFPYTTQKSEISQDKIVGQGERRKIQIGSPVVEFTPVNFVTRTFTPVLQVSPDRIQMQVKVHNKLDRVFRGQGAVVQFLAGGKNQPVDQSAYAELVNIIIPPRGEAVIKLYGPRLADLPDKTTIGLFIYDIVTKTDAAGNVTEKQNFEWYYNLETQLVQDSGFVRSTQMDVPIGPPRYERRK